MSPVLSNLSPVLFSIYINDLALELEAINIGIKIDDQNMINCLLYADDIVLIAENETDLQMLIEIVNTWCQKFRLECNLLKTKILHVRKM